jgi:hypothetical protein
LSPVVVTLAAVGLPELLLVPVDTSTTSPDAKQPENAASAAVRQVVVLSVKV